MVDASARATMVHEAERNVSEITRRETALRNEPFVRIAHHARLLQRAHEAVLAKPDLHPAPR
ncbi:MAG: hypothetical protein FJ096_21755 [Deltaproteobacteria bacterium]|nr:hypothetical protein [Deltaproteobacteria bacterium]